MDPAEIKNLDDLRAVCESCVHCGACQAVCPVYRTGRREELCARGKLKLINDLSEPGSEPSRQLLKTLGRCLLCGRCTQNCPALVPTADTIQAGRGLVGSQTGLPLLKAGMLSQALPHPARMDALARAGRLAGAALPAISGLNLRLPGLAGAERLPAPARRFFLEDAPREIPGPQGAPRLGLFVGCVANYLRPELAHKLIELLSRRYILVIPPSQGCCGLPALAAGLTEPAARLAARNYAAFKQARVDRLVTACGSCAHTLSHQAAGLLPLPEQEAAQALFSQTLELCQVLADEPQILSQLRPAPGMEAAALHHPCHMLIGAGVKQEPEVVLAKAGVQTVDWAGSDQCCGGGGLFSVANPELSQDIVSPHVEELAQARVPVLATSCNGCFIQWRRSLDKGMRVAHPAELVNLS